jgi:hypothetical protein
MKTVMFPCPAAALPLVADQLRGFGATVDMECGTADHPMGFVRFSHDGEHLSVQFESNGGIVTTNMLIGGLRQLVEEAAESLSKDQSPLLVE